MKVYLLINSEGSILGIYKMLSFALKGTVACDIHQHELKTEE